MPFLSIKITPPARLVARRFERLRRKIPVVSRKRLYDAAVYIRSQMKQEGDPVVYPIRWDSVKQRKAFFASDGFGSGIPTRRSGEYQKNWQVIKSEGDDGYDVGNPLAHSKYIGGTARSVNRQSRIHKGRWPLFKEVIEKALYKYLRPKAIVEVLRTIARNEGFRTK